MKIRQGFVSNSSSSSFIINTENLSKDIIKTILDLNSENISDEGKILKSREEYDNCRYSDCWTINEDEDGNIRLWTSMDNGCLSEFLKVNNIHVRLDDTED